MTDDGQPAGTPGTPDPAYAFFADPVERRRAERRRAAEEYAAWLASMPPASHEEMREADEATRRISLDGADWGSADADRPNTN